jgi:GT2 family glycosyltransferase
MRDAGPGGVLIVVVNYRSAALTIDCLRSLEPEVGPLGARAIVVEGGSGDDSAEVLAAAIAERGWSGWASILPLDRNGGFAFANNRAIEAALRSADPPRYVLLLNPDTVVRPGALAALVAFLDDRPGVGIAGSRLEGPDGAPQHSAFRFHSVLSELEHGLRLGLASRLLARWRAPLPLPEGACAVDWVSGASMLVRREVFGAIGLLDEDYFMYYEETDFCLRARRAGWPCWYVPGSRVVHLVGGCSGVADAARARRRRPAYWFRSRRRYFLTHHGRLKTTLADLAWASGYALYRLRRPIQGVPDEDPEHLLGDFLRHNFLRARR